VELQLEEVDRLLSLKVEVDRLLRHKVVEVKLQLDAELQYQYFFQYRQHHQGRH
jgi:hypothetical protein